MTRELTRDETDLWKPVLVFCLISIPGPVSAGDPLAASRPNIPGAPCARTRAAQRCRALLSQAPPLRYALDVRALVSHSPRTDVAHWNQVISSRRMQPLRSPRRLLQSVSWTRKRIVSGLNTRYDVTWFCVSDRGMKPLDDCSEIWIGCGRLFAPPKTDSR